jgi:hypothetical protein
LRPEVDVVAPGPLAAPPENKESIEEEINVDLV